MSSGQKLTGAADPNFLGMRQRYCLADYRVLELHCPSVEELRKLDSAELMQLIQRIQRHLPPDRQRGLTSLARYSERNAATFIEGIERARRPIPIRRAAPNMSEFQRLLDDPDELDQWLDKALDKLRGVIFEAVRDALMVPSDHQASNGR